MSHRDASADGRRRPNADDRKAFRYRAHARVDRVVDGDTWTGSHKPDPQVTIETAGGIRYRLSGVDTHETAADDPGERTKAERETRFTREWIQEGCDEHDGEWPFVIEYESDEYEDAFGRLLVDLVRKSDGAELNDDLLSDFGDDVRSDF